jgi:hypothetical protein
MQSFTVFTECPFYSDGGWGLTLVHLFSRLQAMDCK